MGQIEAKNIVKVQCGLNFVNKKEIVGSGQLGESVTSICLENLKDALA